MSNLFLNDFLLYSNCNFDGNLFHMVLHWVPTGVGVHEVSK